MCKQEFVRKQQTNHFKSYYKSSIQFFFTDTTLYRQQSGCLDVGISKYGIWIVKTNHKIYYRNHDGTNQVHEDTTGWNLVQSGNLDYMCSVCIS